VGRRHAGERAPRDAGAGSLRRTDITFAEAWPDRVAGAFGDVTVSFIGRNAFIRNKKATGRARDLGDIEDLG
jgi:hypothetical protein